MNRNGEEIRVRYLYRNLILKGKVHLSFEAARGLVGPDCAYHLYPILVLDSGKQKKKGRRASRHD